MERDRDERKDDFFTKNVSRPSNPPDELAKRVSKKSLFGRIFAPLFFESSESDRFFTYLHDSNSIFRVGGIKIRMGFGAHGTSKGCHKFSFEDEFKVLGCAMNREGKKCDAGEERMQSANKAMKKIKGWETKTMLRLFRFQRHGCLAIMDHAKWPGRYDTNGLNLSTQNNCRKCVSCHGMGL